MDCHGNWTAAVALMDRGGLPRPPLTLTASILVSFKEPAPPNTPLVVRSSVVEIKEGSQPGVAKVRGPMAGAWACGARAAGRAGWGRPAGGGGPRASCGPGARPCLPPSPCPPPAPSPQSSVEVDVSILLAAPEGAPGATRLLASATGIFKRTGGLRAL
jgi:hypothetical protein